jgi:SAM-dependent methyltransferase
MVQARQDNFCDGRLYHLFVDPVLRKARKLVRGQVKQGSTLIDIGCGTGELLFSLVDVCSELVGIETSNRMWSYASRRAQIRKLDNVSVIFADGAELDNFSTGSFDYATACMVLHEMEESKRLPVLREMQRVARTLILVDYRVPPPANLAAAICRFIERLAGRHHYRNYASFLKGGGLLTLFEVLGLSIQKELSFNNHCFHLIKTR